MMGMPSLLLISGRAPLGELAKLIKTYALYEL